MNPSNLPPQGRYADDRLQQMVIEELGQNGISPDKFYFTSDDWMVTYDGASPAWNSVFGIAAYRKDGQTFYAECGVSQRYDAATSQWNEPAATVKTGLPLGEEEFQAAPSILGGAAASQSQPGADESVGQGSSDQDPSHLSAPADQGSPDGPGSRDEQGTPDSSQTMMASAIPGLPGQEGSSGDSLPGQQDGAAGALPGQEAGSSAAAGAVGVAGGAAAPSEFPSGEEWSAAERADGRPRVEPGPGQEWHHTDRGPEVEREPVPSGDEWSSAEPAASPEGEDGSDPDADLRQAGDLGVDESALAGVAVGGVAGAAGAGAAAASGDSAGSSPEGSSGAEAPSYESAGAEAEAREHPDGGHHAHISGYALRVKEDGTAELQVPLGGQVTLRWEGQKPE